MSLDYKYSPNITEPKVSCLLSMGVLKLSPLARIQLQEIQRMKSIQMVRRYIDKSGRRRVVTWFIISLSLLFSCKQIWKFPILTIPRLLAFPSMLQFPLTMICRIWRQDPGVWKLPKSIHISSHIMPLGCMNVFMMPAIPKFWMCEFGEGTSWSWHRF